MGRMEIFLDFKLDIFYEIPKKKKKFFYLCYKMLLRTKFKDPKFTGSALQVLDALASFEKLRHKRSRYLLIALL